MNVLNYLNVLNERRHFVQAVPIDQIVQTVISLHRRIEKNCLNVLNDLNDLNILNQRYRAFQPFKQFKTFKP